MKKIRLFTPGPTMVPEEVMLEMARPMDHHRTGEYKRVTEEVVQLLEYLFQTEATCLSIAGSGTAGAEAAIVSCCPPGHKALVVRNGKFAERWADVCAAFELPHVNYDVEWGFGGKPEAIERMLAEDPKIDTVIAVHSETSTATISDIEAIAKVTRKRNALLIVDGITSVGALPVKMDAWGVDVYITGSQKAVMLPPGLAFVAVSERAWARIDSGKAHALYNDLKAYRKALKEFDVPYTPAITLMRGARFMLRQIKEIGLENIWAETALLARATRAAATAMGLKVYSSQPSDSVTAILVPPSIDEGALRKSMRATHGMQLAGGQGSLKGKIIRISHMGYVDKFDTLSVIAALELTLKSMGHPVELGSGLAAAQRVFDEAGGKR
ncbi:MAG TPA: alanine--glyoxylate aminotransferase family protein [Phycisphaerae bacterium]|jgi:aspartate aminotransferase-like enzyme